MVRLSNSLIGILNGLTLILSITLIGSSIYLRVHGHTECEKFLQDTLLIIGLVLLALSLLGFLGACCRASTLLWIYLFILSLLILGLFCFMIFAFIVTNHGAGKAISGRGFKEYRLGDYSNWLQNHVVNGKHWGKFRSCLIASKLCMRLGDNAGKASEFNMKDLSPIESGCCKPPTYCGFTFKNATFWEVPKSGPAAPDLDCLTWSNHQETLCYDCKSCKAGILDNVKNDSKKLAAINFCVLIFLSLVHCIGSCAYKGNRDERYKRYRGYP